MIDQVLEAKDYLAGKNISPQNMYRICYVMARLLHREGLGHLESRDRIFQWGKENNIKIVPSVNSIIEKAANDKSSMNDGLEVWIGQQDVDEIVRRFDRRLTRCDALAVLCYSKVYANRRGEFTLPHRSLTGWVGEGKEYTHWKVIRELLTFEYIEIANISSGVRRWDKKELSDGSVYKLIVPVSKDKKYMLEGNNIWKLHDTIFAK